VCITKETNNPRYAAPKNIIAALDKPLVVWNAQALEADAAQIGTPGSPSITRKIYEPPKTTLKTVYFEGSAKEKAAQFVDELARRNLV